jgi:hypothetical protein
LAFGHGSPSDIGGRWHLAFCGLFARLA